MREAVRLDGLAVRAARGSGAADLEIGDVLLRLFEGDRLIQLGCAKHADYIRERLGTQAATGLAYLSVRGRAGEKLDWHIHATGERWTATGDDDVLKGA